MRARARSTLPLLLALCLLGCGRLTVPVAGCPEGQRCDDQGLAVADRGSGGGGKDAGQPVLRDAVRAADQPLLRDAGAADHPGPLQPDASFVCAPNHDDRIDRSEIVIAVGQGATFMMGSKDLQGGTLVVNLEGTPVNGRPRWDLAAEAADDHQVSLKLEPIPASAAASFPSTAFASLDLQASNYVVYGIYQVTPTALQSLGATTQGLTAVLDAPIDLLRFPIAPKDSYSTTAGTKGQPGMQAVVTVEVLAAGDLQLPAMTLPVVLQKITEKQAAPYLPVVLEKVTFIFISECFGVVAMVEAMSPSYASLAAVPVASRLRLSP